MKITKAVIAAAGQGTRFLPMTKAMPKEMLPIIDKPIIQYVVEEAVAAGITDVIIVNGANKRPIEDHFDHQYELENQLIQKGKGDIAKRMKDIADMANFVYLRQKGPYGNGIPVLNASHLVHNEPFLVLFADDFFQSKVPRAVQLVEAYKKVKKSVITLIPMEKKDVGSYGVPFIEKEVQPGLFELKGVVEKPDPQEAPSYNGKYFASVAGYILTPDIIPILEKQQPDHTGEVYLPVAINELAKTDKVYGQVIEGRWHDAGNKEKYLQAVVDFALEDPELGAGFKNYIKSKLN